jgi:hypothetical protein
VIAKNFNCLRLPVFSFMLVTGTCTCYLFSFFIRYGYWEPGTFVYIFSTPFLGKLSDITDRTKDVMEAAAKESSSKVISAYLQAALLINSQVFIQGRIPLDVSALRHY